MTTPGQQHDPSRVVVNHGQFYGRNGGSGLPIVGDLAREMSVPIETIEHGGDPARRMDPQTGLLFARLQEIQDMLRQRRLNFDLQHPVDEYQSTLNVPVPVNWTDA
jgi:hypothetical protein